MIGDILQPTHLLLILVVALIVLGPKRLPETAKSLGRGLRDFRNALSGHEDQPERESLRQPPAADSQTVAHPQPVAQAETTPEPHSASEPETEAQSQPPADAQLVEGPQPVSTGAPSEPGERSS